MKILLDLQNSMRAVTLNSEFSLCGLTYSHTGISVVLHNDDCNGSRTLSPGLAEVVDTSSNVLRI